MDVDIKYKPSFATLFVTLAAGDSIVAESDAMASMSSNVGMRTRFNGGFFQAVVKKLFGGESLFVNEFFLESGETGQIVLTQPTVGDMERVDLDGNKLFLQPGAYVASGPDVKMSVGWAGLVSWLMGEGLFRLQMSGTGPVWFGGYGGVYEKDVAVEYMVDNGHLLAYEPGLTLHIAMAGGLFATLFGGEGLITRIEGSGKIYMQSRSMDGLVSWTNAHLY
jgi:uncharacterized protein (TIGR00266 family)